MLRLAQAFPDINPVEGHESYLQIHWIATQLVKYFDFLSYIKTMTDMNANTNLYIKCFCPMQLNHNNDLLNLFLRASSGKKLSETLDLTFCQLQLGVKNILMHILCCAFLHKSLFNADLDAPLLNQRIYHCYIILCRILKEHWSFLRSPA